MKMYLHIKYWVLPLIVISLLMVMYFSGVKWAQELICPSVNWELGIVENMQLGLLLMINVISIAGIIKKIPSIEKIVVVPYTTEKPDLTKLPNSIHYSDFKAELKAISKDHAIIPERPLIPFICLLVLPRLRVWQRDFPQPVANLLEFDACHPGGDCGDCR